MSRSLHSIRCFSSWPSTSRSACLAPIASASTSAAPGSVAPCAKAGKNAPPFASHRSTPARSFSSSCSAPQPAPAPASASASSYTSRRPPIPVEVRRTVKPVTFIGAAPKATATTPASELDGEPSTVVADEAVADLPATTVEAEVETYTPPPLTQQSLSLLYSFTTPPPPSALAAFAGRLASSVPRGSEHSLASDLALLEQCLIHESFWTGVGVLPPSAASKRRYTNFHDAPLPSTTTTTTSVLVQRAHNGPLASVGNALLGTLTAEILLNSFPNLPTQVTKAALTMFVGPKSLAAVATSWGVSPTRLDQRLVGKADEKKMSRKEKAYGHLVGGVGPARKKELEGDGAGGMGLVRWNRQPVSPQRDAVLFEDALASVSRAVLGAIYRSHGFAAAREFAYAHFLARLLPSPSSNLPSAHASSAILPLLKFTNPTLTLSAHLSKYRRERASHRLLKESGRLSNHATFVCGVYSGAQKLGEGFGSSIKMSEWRASEDALRRLYLGGKKGGNELGSDGWMSS